MRKQFILAIISVIAFGATATTPLFMRDAAISPDGQKIAFTYKGDIWTVPAAGGNATRITMTDQYYEASPVWSPDSRSLAFRSNRAGSFDVYITDANGGEVRRLTFDSGAETPEAFTPDGKSLLFSAFKTPTAETAAFPSSRLTQLYSVPVEGGRPMLVSATPVLYPVFSPVNKNILYYQDIKGFEDQWRKHHTSSDTRDVWMLDLKSGKHVNLTERGGEDRNPVISPDGKTLYFLSERNGGSMNVYSMEPRKGAVPSAVTSFESHPVRFLSGAGDGTLAFTYDGEIYTMRPGSQPSKVDISLSADFYQPVKRIPVSSAQGGVPSPDGKQIAFINRGDVFVTSVEFPTTRQITKTVEGESQINWQPDGKAIVYTSERDGHWNIYKATVGHDGDPDFANATIITEDALFPASDGVERTCPSYSPDGSKLAFVADRNKLMVMDVASGNVKQITDGHTHTSRGGSISYSWSPDSRWIVMDGILHHHDPYSDIILVNAADGTLIPLTETGYFDESPKFVLDGNAVMFGSDRYGMRAHASWGSEQDVMIVFLNSDAYDKFRLSEQDYALRTELEKENAKKSAEKDNGKKEEKDKKNEDKVKEIVVEPDGIQDRIIRLTPNSSNLGDAIITADGASLFYLSAFEGGYDLWKKDLRKGDVKLVSKNVGGGSLVSDKDGKNYFLLSRTMRKLDPKSDKLTPISFSGTMSLDEAAEREYMFDYVKCQERERFYEKNMHGVDWENLTEHYRRFLPHISNNYDFATLLSEMLGELNVSHTGGRYTAPANPNLDRTASLGLMYDMTARNRDGLVVSEVIDGGPMDKSWSKIKAGDVITAIGGKKLKSGEPVEPLLANLAGQKTLVEFTTKSGKTDREVVVPISASQENELLYRRWIKQRAADVDRWSNGRLGYVHIRSMGDPSYRDMYADVLGKYNDRDGIVIDVRWNGGGRLHEDVEVLFSGKHYFTQVVRGVEACAMPSRRWNKPSIMVMAEPCYSNAHGTPWVYSHMGLGKLVGRPVPGTMTSVNWVTMQDPSMVFGIPVTGYRTHEGTYLENSQLDPDVHVTNTPEALQSGEDTQLRVAVETLLKDIDSQK
ncbi:MAG: S41 family peptidase [Muribaculaceae bacterium]|jgi:Periplasmic protease|nr:S41 family peptidase [Muribaculaceae bacterium]